MRDLESALVYSLGHEVAQHTAITGDALNALQVAFSTTNRTF